MTTEHIASSILCTLLALPLSLFAVLNLFGARLGKTGRKLLFEMDEVMGGLLGIPHFSKLEGSILTLGAIGCLLSWSVAGPVQVFTVLGLTMSVVYMVVCSAYAVVARQPMVPYLGVAAVMVAAALWRALRLMPTDAFQQVSFFAAGAALLCAAAAIQMRRRAQLMEPKITKLIAIQAFVEHNMDWDWKEGESGPVGFVQTD